MNKVFYNAETLEIKGFSDGEVSMDFPYIETDHMIRETYSIRVIQGTNGPELAFKESFSDDEWDEIING